MSHRSLLTISALTLGDFVLWHWSLGGDRDVVALVSGLTLLPLLAITLWGLAVNVLRLLARGAHESAVQLKTRTARRVHAHSARGRRETARSSAPSPARRPGVTAASAETKRKIAA